MPFPLKKVYGFLFYIRLASFESLYDIDIMPVTIDSQDLTSFAKDGTGGVQMYLRKVMVLQLFYPSREYI